MSTVSNFVAGLVPSRRASSRGVEVLRRLVVVSSLVISVVVSVPLAAATTGEGGCDFNGDGFHDLAVGVPGDHVSGFEAAGSVHVIYGTGSGLAAAGDQVWHRDKRGIKGAAAHDADFGRAVDCGDFNNDGFSDLAAGAPRDGAGSVSVIYGSESGLSAAGDQVWHRDRPGIRGDVAGSDEFGSSLAVGDFNGDGFDDLAVGVPRDWGIPRDWVTGGQYTGSVHVIYGSESGLSPAGDQIWHRDRRGIKGNAVPGHVFGWSLAAADFDGDGFDDLAVGVPGDDVGVVWGAGSVSVIYGTGRGLSVSGDQVWHRDIPGIRGSIDGDVDPGFFAGSLAAGDFNGDGFDDLAVGVPRDYISDRYSAGSVHVIYGTAAGLSAAGDRVWHRDKPGIRGTAGSIVYFGDALDCGDFNGDGFDDLAVGVSLDAVGESWDAGSVHVIYGSESGLSAAGDQIWHRDRRGITGIAGTYDNFGASLASGDYDRDGFDDLTVGVPRDDLTDAADAGSVHVIYGTAARLSAAGDQIWHRDKPGINATPQAGDRFGHVGNDTP